MQIQYADFLLFVVVLPKCCGDQGSNSIRKSEIFQSDLTSHQSLKLTELLSQVGGLKNIS